MAEPLKWKEEWTVVHPKMDEQHKKLLALINQLELALNKPPLLDNEKVLILKKSFIELFDYVIFHFKEEEELLEKYCPQLLHFQHKEHGVFTMKITKMQKNLDKDPKDSCERLCHFLKSWLISHILQEDKKYAPFIPQS